MGTILTTIGALVLGGVVAAATIVGVVSSQTAAPDKSPTNVNAPVIEYGSN
ncbi:hypothetical protein NPS01_08760 [Nocardioides psychrotolerans]|uniref:DUF2613 domain-containing protein n=1 Tax=Nocardioides psychrotolerans TaxID=1005945 RepID=A0A1I3FN82_9ACTN|nr:hypothetical protein [Nocardioides psychrotolerans]GEP37213.1 hypothetical protein NPS01_08760 [Nocardioides psychrotolerans]SFI12401.1 hypothetical protein SAMN05216561_10556 [Nocardioides psychrotolerans]